jgi:hypothetical protein
MPDQAQVDLEKLFALARGARARIGAPVGAAVVDSTGRTYSAAEVDLPHLRLSALALAVAQAAAAGAERLHGAVLVAGRGAVPEPDLQVFADLAEPGSPLVVRSQAGGLLAEVVLP